MNDKKGILSELKQYPYWPAIICFCISPLHFMASCQNSGRISGIAGFLMLLTIILTIIKRNSLENRMEPPLVGLVALIMHTLFSH